MLFDEPLDFTDFNIGQHAPLPNFGASVTTDEGRFTALDAVYYGGFSYYYVIGIGDGATFLNNYVAPVEDFTSRIGRCLLWSRLRVAYRSRRGRPGSFARCNSEKTTLGSVLY